MHAQVQRKNQHNMHVPDQSQEPFAFQIQVSRSFNNANNIWSQGLANLGAMENIQSRP